MANYIVTNSKFKPFSYEEVLQPVLRATEAHQNLEEQYADLSTKANVWENLADAQSDPVTYYRYKRYANDLKSAVNRLAEEGLTPTSRQDLLNMKSRYSSEIIPIEQAYSRRQELIDEQRKALMSDPSLMYDIDFRTISLGDLLTNPSMSYSSVSGNDLYKKGKEAAISASSRISSISPSLQNQYWNIKRGYGAEAANKFLLDQSNIPELKNAVDRIISQSKVSKDNINRATDYVISGIMSGMTYDENYQSNKGYVDSIERDRIDLAREQFEWTKNKWNDEQLGIELPNGNRVKDVGGGRVRITYPDGRVEVIGAPKSVDTKKPFPGLQFKMWNESKATSDFQEGLSFVWSYKKKGFAIRDEELISYTDFSPAMQSNIAAKLGEYGLTPDDVEIWRDKDGITDNHYQIRLKQPKSDTSQNVIEGFGEL